MDLKELHGIIKACGEAKVSKLKIGDLYLEFGTTYPEIAKTTPPPAAEMVDQEKKSILQDEQRIKRDQLDNLLLEDPELYEEFLQRGELVDGGAKAL